MKTSLKLLVLGMTVLSLTARADLVDQIKSAVSGTNVTAGSTSLSQDQVVNGLKQALGKGITNAIGSLGHTSGFLTNLNVKIQMPGQLQPVEKALRLAGQNKLADDFVASMNHAAEQAVSAAGNVFSDSIKQMSIADAKTILTGPNDAATQYFRKTTQTNLYAVFYPIVQKATAQVGVTAKYKEMTSKFTSSSSLGSLLGSTSPVKLNSADIDSYVTNKAMDGLFKMVAAEEKNIRTNPVARTTDLLKSVFGTAQ